ncbi:hypothetical protein ACQ0N1_08785 [Lactiplantibacillus plantarum]|uniref:hypothetical protein n=1 Tax=Lactiplantibacillus plantarum TaxID=1590 RepID=UPI00311EB648
MSRPIHSKYGYEPPEWVQVDAQLDKWCKDKKRRAKRKRRKQHAKDKKMPLS